MKRREIAHNRPSKRRLIRQRILAGLFAAVMGSAVSGCSTTMSDIVGTSIFTGGEWYLAFDVISIVNSDKTLIDHAVLAFNRSGLLDHPQNRRQVLL